MNLNKTFIVLSLIIYSNLILAGNNDQCKAFTIGMSYESATKQFSTEERKIFEGTKSSAGVHGEEDVYDYPNDINSQLRLFVKNGVIVDILDDTPKTDYKFCSKQFIAQIGMTPEQINKIYNKKGQLIISLWNSSCNRVDSTYEWEILGLGTVEASFKCGRANELTLYTDDNN